MPTQAAAPAELRLVDPGETGGRSAPASSARGRDDHWSGLVIEAFQEIAVAACSDSVTLDGLLRLVGRRLCNLLGVSRCSVYLRREDGRFQGQVGYCAGRASIDARVSRLVSGVDGFTAEIVQSHAPVIVHDASRDPRTIQRTMRQWRVKDMLGVPLVVDDEVIGIIYVDDQAQTHDFSERDIQLAEAFAGLSAFAVKQTWQWERLVAQTKALDLERRVLDRAADVRRLVTRAMTDGADLDDILALAARELRKPLVMYNRSLEPTAWVRPEDGPSLSAPTLVRDELDRPALGRAIAKLESSTSAVMIRATPDLKCRRRLVRLAVDDETMGYLELYELGTPFNAADASVLEELSAAIALKLRLDQRFGTREVVGRMDYLVDLLFGRREATVIEARGPSFGVDAQRGHVVMVLPPPSDQASAVDARSAQEEYVDQLADFVRPQLRLVDQLAMPEHHLAILEVCDPQCGRAGLRQVLEQAVGQLATLHAVEHVVFTELCESLGEVPDAVRQAVGVADLLRSHPMEGLSIAFAHDLELLRLVTRGNDFGEVLRSAEQVLRPLIEHDRSSGGDLVETLRAFIDCGAQFRGTAARLGVHENTVRYRLNRIGELSSIDANNFQDLTRAQFAFQVGRLLPMRGGAAPADQVAPLA